MIAFARFSDHVKGGNLGSLPDEYDLVVKGMALVGTLVGQVRPHWALGTGQQDLVVSRAHKLVHSTQQCGRWSG